MDVIDRDRHEAELAASVASVFGELRRTIEGNPTRAVANPHLWTTAERATEDALTAYLLLLYRRAFDSFEESGRLSPWMARRSATDWATARGKLVSGELITGSRERITARLRADDLDRVVATEFGVERAVTVAVTEVTQTWSAAEHEAARELASLGLRFFATWEIEDNEACPICFDLDGTPYEDWRERFPNGPPAHPRCRCRQRWHRR